MSRWWRDLWEVCDLRFSIPMRGNEFRGGFDEKIPVE